MKFSFKKMLFASSVAGVMILSACTANESSEEQNDNATNDDNTENYSEAVDYTITGIEPVSGISFTTEELLEEYENLQCCEIELSSTTAMISELGKKINNEEPIIVTTWNPQWMIAKYLNLKYLD